MEKQSNYPICVTCKNHSVGYIQVGNGNELRSAKTVTCQEFLHPITGQPLNCQEARQDERFCGFTGKGYEKVEEPRPNLTVISKDVNN